MNKRRFLALLALPFISSARAATRDTDMPILGEVRTFATGFVKNVKHVDKRFAPMMETANFVWDGRRWCKEGSLEASEAMKRIYERYLNSSVRNE